RVNLTWHVTERTHQSLALHVVKKDNSMVIFNVPDNDIFTA
ncbi:MAG: hypothetical protein ACI952_000290, partial [Flavobacteriales bacterium]